MLAAAECLWIVRSRKHEKPSGEEICAHPFGDLLVRRASTRRRRRKRRLGGIRIGAGARYVAKYEGSDETKARALPLIDITWKDLVFLNPRNGLGVHLYNEGGLTLSAGVVYVFARDESDGDALKGMGDVDETAAASLILKYDLGLAKPYASVSRHLGRLRGDAGEGRGRQPSFRLPCSPEE